MVDRGRRCGRRGTDSEHRQGISREVLEQRRSNAEEQGPVAIHFAARTVPLTTQAHTAANQISGGGVVPPRLESSCEISLVRKLAV